MIFITGASGIVGSFLCKALQDNEVPFKGLIRANSSRELLNSIKEENLLEGDLTDPISYSEYIHEGDLIVHCAAVISFDPAQKNLMTRVNVEATRDLVNIALEKKAGKFIHISSVAAIGVNKGELEASEKNTWPGTSTPSTYGISKHEAELEVYRAEAEGLNILILNPSTILAPGTADKSSTRLFDYVWKEKPFYTVGEMNYVDIRDLVNILLHFIHSDISGEKYIVSGGKVPYKELFAEMAKHFGKKAPFVKAGKALTILAVSWEWLKSKITGIPPMITAESALRGKSTVLYSHKKVSEELNYSFYPLIDSVKWTCSELKKNWKNN